MAGRVLVALVAVGWPFEAALAGGVTTSPSASAGETPVIIYRDPKRYTSFPDVQRLPDGRLLCVFRDAAFQEPIRHIEPDARVVGTLSRDNGRHWSEPFAIYNDPACQNDPSMAVLRDGKLLLTFFNWNGVNADYVSRHKPPSAIKVDRGEWGEYAVLGGTFLLRGSSSPLTWEKQAERVTGDPTTDLYATSSSILETKRGTLLLPIYGRSSAARRGDESFVLRSTDGGRSWGKPILIASDPEEKIEFQEPALGQAADGTIVSMMRTAKAGDHLYACRSADDGRTWSRPEETPLIGHPADVDLLPGGKLLVVYGYRHKPFGVRVCVSADNGRTWDRSREIVIAAAGAHGDLGYPSACLTGDGHVLIAYYMNGPNTHDRWIECKRVPLLQFR